jgi:hypothetical protein
LRFTNRALAIAATALCCLGTACVCDRALADEMSILELGESVEVTNSEDDGFAEVTDTASLPEPDPSRADIVLLPPSDDPPRLREPVDEPPPALMDACDCSDGECGELVDPTACCRAAFQGWVVEVGASALQTQMAVSDLEHWPDNFGAAGRISLGYEWASGLGVRTQAWGYSMEGDVKRSTLSSYYRIYDDWYVPGATNSLLYAYPYSYLSQWRQPIEISAATVYWDVYKSLRSSLGELQLGMGPAFAHFEINLPPYGDGTEYNGGGVSLFGEGSLPILRRNRWELALAGKSRIALLAGKWGVSNLTIQSDSAHSELMSIFELSFGPEVRFRVGRGNERQLFLQTLAEFQQWRSDEMGLFGGDTLGMQGVTLNGGMLW